jgi:hypothetical protein
MAKLQVYVKDLQFFNKVCKSIQSLWYTRYGISLSKGDIILKSLKLLEENLLGDAKTTNDSKGQDIHKYKRIGV